MEIDLELMKFEAAVMECDGPEQREVRSATREYGMMLVCFLGMSHGETNV